MPSPRKNKQNIRWSKYEKKYNKAWENEPLFAGWLQKTPDPLINEGKSEAYCTLCETTIRPHKSDLKSHRLTTTHQRCEKALPSAKQPQLSKFGFEGPQEVKEKYLDLRLAAVVACHSSVRSIDHIGEVVRGLGKGSNLENLRLHRTKCSKLICKVIAPCLLHDLVDDIGQRTYSIICDESTDITTRKLFALCVRYYSEKRQEMMTLFLGMIETPRTTALELYEAFKTFIQSIGLSLKWLEALGTDGAASLCGSRHSLYTLLKKNDCPNLQIIRCMCHSLDKCASNACKELPSSLEHFIRDSRNWFCHSSTRKYAYATLYKEMFVKDPPLLVKLAETRWLSWHGAVSTHLDQYSALKELFNNISKNPKESCPAAHALAELHNDKKHLLLLTFLKPILDELTNVNLVFQSTYADITSAYRDLRIFVSSCAQRIIRPEALKRSLHDGMIRMAEVEALKEALHNQNALKPLEMVSFGEKFRRLAEELSRQGGLSPESVRDVKVSCANYLGRLCKELVDRLPSCIEEIDRLRHFSPARVLAKTARPSFNSLPFERTPVQVGIDVLESQWNSLGTMTLNEICPEEHSPETVDIVKFWGLVSNLKNSIGKRPFQQLADSVLAFLSLPLSNAFVERVFSIMNIVKNKLRNKMSLEMLNSIIFLRLYLQSHKICCTKFEPTEAMSRRFNSRTMYQQPERPRNVENEIGLEENPDNPEAVPDDERGGPYGQPQEGPLQDSNENVVVEVDDDPEAIDALLCLLEEKDSILSSYLV